MADIADFADAAILSVCAAFNELQLRKAALLDTIPSDSERYFAVGAINAEQDPLVSRLVDLRATSLEAQLARLRLLSLLTATQREEDAAFLGWVSRLTAAGLRDLHSEAPD
jgi:hypothetical protein